MFLQRCNFDLVYECLDVRLNLLQKVFEGSPNNWIFGITTLAENVRWDLSDNFSYFTNIVGKLLTLVGTSGYQLFNEPPNYHIKLGL